MKKCITCNRDFIPSKNLSKNKREKAKFCSRSCYWRWMKNNITPPSQRGKLPWNKGRGIVIKCKYCEKDFYIPSNRMGRAKYCSKKCADIDAKNRSVSFETRKKISLNSPFKGENHPNWKGGISKKNKDFRNVFMQTVEYKFWRDSVYKRDKYTCQICGDNKGGNLNANHIKRFSDYPKLRLDVNNGITLCKECHISIVTHHENDWESYFKFNLEVNLL